MSTFQLGTISSFSDPVRNRNFLVDPTDVFTFTTDVFKFSIGLNQNFNISLTGLSADADIRLIEDVNFNENVNLGDEIARSQAGGTNSEFIGSITDRGEYYLQVYQFSGDTNYTVNIDQFAIG